MTIETELPAVKVKALEWTHEDDGEYIAYSEIGWYHIGRPASFWNLTVPCGEVPSFETLEAAQAAAQQDYSARIISALTIKDDPGNGGDGEAERLTRLTRPIIGIENRTPLEVFDIMADRIRAALRNEGDR